MKRDSHAELGVVHLVRRTNDIDVFRRFLDSYRRHAAGAPHELVLVFKGFDDERSSESHRQLAADVCSRWLTVPDDGFDLGAYSRAARALPHRRLVFLNSFSVILVENWLELLAEPAHDPRVGAVSASGSWGSQASHLRYGLGLGGPYARVFGDRASTEGVFADLTAAGEESERQASGARRRLDFATTLARQAVGFPPFPAVHLRTNGLLIGRETWLRACRTVPRDKLSAHRLESGRGGVTARLRASGLDVVVVGRDARAYGHAEWPASRTFWQGDQENLLVGDNQTWSYRVGDDLRRRVLSGYAWGPEATASVRASSEAS